MREQARVLWLIVLLVACSTFAAEGRDRPHDLAERAERLRAEEKYDEAIALYRKALVLHPDDADLLRGLAETLAWDARYEEAISVYRGIFASRAPDEVAALGYARALQWSGDYPGARNELRRLLNHRPSSLDALEELARTSYWQGDFREAARLYQQLLDEDPSRERAAGELAEIRAFARPIVISRARWRSDDQPLRSAGGELEAVLFSDPLTQWSVTLGSRRFDSRVTEADVWSAGVAAETVFPWMGVTVGASVEPTRMPTGNTEWFGSATIGKSFGTGVDGSLFYSRSELLWTVGSLDTGAYVSSTGAEITYDRSGYLGTARVREMVFFDDNEGVEASGYFLVPLVARAWTVDGGASFLLRDTDETRFVIDSIEAAPVPGGFAYDYDGRYDPYWTPINLREFRLVVSAGGEVGPSLRLKIDGTVGVAHDDATSFGPDIGLFTLPFETFATVYERRYEPWSLALTLQKQWKGVEVQVRVERTVTVHYEADEAIATLVRRF